MMSVTKPQFGQIQLFVRGNRMSESLLQKTGERCAGLALTPGAIHTSNPYSWIGHTFNPKRNALPHLNCPFFDVGTVKKRYFWIFACHFIYSLLPTIETPLCFESFAPFGNWLAMRKDY